MSLFYIETGDGDYAYHGWISSLERSDAPHVDSYELTFGECHDNDCRPNGPYHKHAELRPDWDIEDYKVIVICDNCAGFGWGAWSDKPVKWTERQIQEAYGRFLSAWANTQEDFEHLCSNCDLELGG